MHKAKEAISPADVYARNGDLEMAAHCRRQDRERAAAADLPPAEYVALCMRQVRENCALAALRRTARTSGFQGLEEVWRELGVRASER